MNNRLFILLAVVVFLVGLWFIPPYRSTVPQYSNMDDSVQYVGDEECAACHSELYNSFIKTGMGRSFYPAENAAVIEDFSHPNPTYDTNRDFYYTAAFKDGKVSQTEFRLNEKGERIYELSRTADYIIGSGNHNRTYLTVKNGFLKELPLTWYSDKQKWDLSPGYHSTNMRFSRPIVEECMHCHNSYTEISAYSQSRYNKPLPNGIGCERCHGPGQLHVQQRLENSAINTGQPDVSIINPKNLPFQEQLDVCQQCHLQGEISVFLPDKRSSDFRPGMQLSTIKSIFMEKNPKQNVFRIASHAERLSQSECFQKSKSLTCITCHDPHVPVQEHPRSSFNDNCLACHNVNSLQLENLEYHQQSADCVSCHMLQGGTADIPHVNFTDHKIQRYSTPIQSSHPTAIKINKAPVNLVNYFTGDKTVNAIQTGIAYVRLFESRHQQKGYLINSISLLEESLKEKDGQVAGWYHFGRAHHLLGNGKKAVSAYQQTIDQDPDHPLAYAQLGFLAIENEKFIQAVSLFRQSVKSDPYNPVVWNNYGQALLFSDSSNQALSAYTTAIQLDQDYANAYNNRGELLLYQQNKVKMSKNDFMSCLALDPDHIFALHNMSNIAILEEDLLKAEKFAFRALVVNSDFVPAYGTLATVFAQQGRIEEAKQSLSTMIKLEPNNVDARKILDSLLD